MTEHNHTLDEDLGGQDPDADLVAYLDGELSPAQRRDIEVRLASDANYRAHVRELQESWDLLDVLPQAPENKSLTQTTVALATSENASLHRPGFRISGRQWRLLAAALLTGWVGFSLVYFPLKWRVNRQLRDLPVAQNIEIYRYADDIEFLQALHDQGMFHDEEADDY